MNPWGIVVVFLGVAALVVAGKNTQGTLWNSVTGKA